jgi:outer membrane receptor protein involved in Fe transport
MSALHYSDNPLKRPESAGYGWSGSIVILIACMLQTALAEPIGITGILEGRVRDKQTKEPLVGATIAVLGTTQGATSDSEGKFKINNIRAGLYDVRFSYVGYKTQVMTAVTILPDLRTRLDIDLEVGAVQLEGMEIRATRPLIQKDQASTAFNISETKLDRLPISKFADALSLQPGVTQEGNVRGGKINEVVYLVDGMPIQDVVSGGIGINLPKTAINGMTIHTGGFDAEYGNALSGVVNVITKNASNESKYGVRVEQDDWVPYGLIKQVDKLLEMEVNAAGPIINDRVFFFFANNFNFSDTRWWQDFRHSMSSPIKKEISGFGKIEYVPSATMRLNLQGVYTLQNWRDYEYSWRYNLPGLPPRSKNSYRVALTASQTLSDRSYYTFSLSTLYNQSRIGEGPKSDVPLIPYQYDFFLRYVIDGSRSWWQDARQHIYSVKGEYTTELWKNHMVKLGAELNQYDIFSDLLKLEPQKTYFGKPIADAPLLNYSNSYSYRPRSGSVYLQDKAQIVEDGSNFSVGLRWDFFDPTAERPLVDFVLTNPNVYQETVTGTVKSTLKQQLSPRISLALPLGESNFFFINYGHYFQLPLFDYLYSGLNPAQISQGTKNIQAGNPDLEPERVILWEAGFKRSLNEDVVGSLTFFRKEAKNQIDSKTLVPFDSKAAGDYGFATYVNNAEANSTGIELMLSRERSDVVSGSFSYTYMVTEGVSEYADQQVAFSQWGFSLPARSFPLSWDQRHTLKGDIDLKLPGGIQGNAILLYNTPRPYTYYPTRDGFTALDTTKVFLPNNARMYDVFLVNLKLFKQIPLGDRGTTVLTLYADIRNVFNRANVRWVDSNSRIGGELQDPGAYYDPRRVRVGIRVEF